MKQETVQFRCATPHEAIHTIKALLGKQVQRRDIEVISSEPIPELHPLMTGRSRLPAFVISGAVMGIVAGFLLAAGTAWLYPLNTGGMPVISLLPVGIVSYETMMMFAVLFGLAGLLIETRMARKTSVPSSERQAISDGEVLILVRVAAGTDAAGLKSAALQ